MPPVQPPAQLSGQTSGSSPFPREGQPVSPERPALRILILMATWNGAEHLEAQLDSFVA